MGAAMLPVHALEALRNVVERLTQEASIARSTIEDGRPGPKHNTGKGKICHAVAKEVPLFTVEAIWLLPREEDPTMHPWCASLLWIARQIEAMCVCKSFCVRQDGEALDAFLTRTPTGLDPQCIG